MSTRTWTTGGQLLNLGNRKKNISKPRIFRVYLAYFARSGRHFLQPKNMDIGIILASDQVFFAVHFLCIIGIFAVYYFLCQAPPTCKCTEQLKGALGTFYMKKIRFKGIFQLSARLKTADRLRPKFLFCGPFNMAARPHTFLSYNMETLVNYLVLGQVPKNRLTDFFSGPYGENTIFRPIGCLRVKLFFYRFLSGIG